MNTPTMTNPEDYAAENRTIISGARHKPAAAPKKGKADQPAKAKGAKRAKAEKPAKQPKPAKEPKAPKIEAEKPLSRRAQADADAAAGILPPTLAFTAEGDRQYAKKVEALNAAALAGDIKALMAIEIVPYSSSRKKMFRWRELAVAAIEVNRKASRAAAKAGQKAEPAADLDIPAFLKAGQ